MVLDGCAFWLPPNSIAERSSPEQVALYQPPHTNTHTHTHTHTHLGAKIISDKRLKRAAPLGKTSRILEAPELSALYSIHLDPSSDKNPVN